MCVLVIVFGLLFGVCGRVLWLFVFGLSIVRAVRVWCLCFIGVCGYVGPLLFGVRVCYGLFV